MIIRKTIITLAIISVVALAYPTFNWIKKKHEAKIEAERIAEVFRQIKIHDREDGKDFDADYEEEAKREERYPTPNPRSLTNGATANILEILNDTNSIIRQFPTDEQTKQYAVLTKDGIFALREQDGSVKYCENISDFFCACSASDVYEFYYMRENALCILVEFYTNDPIIIASPRYGQAHTISINLADGRIQCLPQIHSYRSQLIPEFHSGKIFCMPK